MLCTVAVVVSLLSTVAVASDCVSDYQQLEAMFRQYPSNYANLSESIFSTNRVSSRYLVVTYHMTHCGNWTGGRECGSVVATDQWVWSQSIVHMFFHPFALYYLSLRFDDTGDRMAAVDLTIPVPCDNQAHKLLSRLTQLLRWYAKNPSGSITFTDDDSPGRSYKADQIDNDFANTRILCVVISYSTIVAVLLVGAEVARKSENKLTATLTSTNHFSVLYGFSVVWIVDTIWIFYLDFKMLFGYNGLDIPKDIYSSQTIMLIVIADMIIVAVVLIMMLFLIKKPENRGRCYHYFVNKIFLQKYLVLASFLTFAAIHGNHIIFVLFAYLAEPIHAMAKLIEFVTAVAYFISIFRIVFHEYQQHNTQCSKLQHICKLCVKLVLFYLYFVVLFFLFSNLIYHDLMVTDQRTLIKSISVSTLVWLVTLTIHYSDRWSNQNSDTDVAATTNKQPNKQPSTNSRKTTTVSDEENQLSESNQLVPTVDYSWPNSDMEQLVGSENDSFDV